MNSCNFVGRLTADPELRRTPEGTAVCSYSLAVKRPMVKDTTDFIDFVSWRQSAEYLAQYAHKGDIVAATGTLQPRAWTDKDGNKRKAFEVVTTGVELVSAKKDSQVNNQPTHNQNGFQSQLQRPQQPQYQQQVNGGFQQPQQGYQKPQYNQQTFGGYHAPQQNDYQQLDDDDQNLPF